ncbi:KH domain-containing protein [Bdellovibrio svalbardensis]|uniref:RNA-binding protein KhpA n=1 Tax=Bdellovibrio svalbardensis TaxID=2972972 RepID=A0ABT6DKY8_9BACT|nr:KH domain-containing protein [Bdellovibrio svalbardensis]MDG0815778.1 KH domain-containing protein [Bdellovibrio svalbardensis]
MNADNRAIPNVIRLRKTNSTPDSQKEELRHLIEMILKDLVSYPEDIQLTYADGDQTTVYTLNCPQRVIGQVLGTRGKNITGIRVLMTSISSRKGFRAIIEVPHYPNK